MKSNILKYQLLLIILGLASILIGAINLGPKKHELDVLRNGEEIIGIVTDVDCKTGKSSRSYIEFDYNNSSHTEMVKYYICKEFQPGDPIIWKSDKKDTFVYPLERPADDINNLYVFIFIGIGLIIASVFLKFLSR